MKSILTPAYTFNVTNKTLDLSGITGFSIKRLAAVINLTAGNVPLFIAGAGGTLAATVAGSVLTFAASMAGMSNTDDLQIIYDDTAPLPVTDTDSAVLGPYTATSATNLFSIDTTGYKSVMVQLYGTWAGTVTFETSNDNTNWSNVNYVNSASSGSSAGGATTTANGAYTFPAVLRYFRARVSTFTSGTFSATAMMRHESISFNSVFAYVSQTLQTGAPGGTTTGIKSAATTNATSLKTSAANISFLSLSNNTATDKYFKLYNKTSAPVVGTDATFTKWRIPANGSLTLAPNVAIRMTTGLAYAITGGLADNDTTAVAVDDVTGVMLWA